MKKLSTGMVIVISLLAGLVGGYAGSELSNELGQSEQANQESKLVIDSQSDLIANIAQTVGPSVVSITSTTTTNSFFGSYDEQGSGTGVIISDNGYVLTNRHVVPEGTTAIQITLEDGTEYNDVEVIGRDPRGGVDLAFLKINDVKDLKPAKFGDSDSVRVGDSVIAIGNALGEFQNSVTTGIISGRSRPIVASDGLSGEALTNLLQTDAAINPGNSGGPLLNLDGEVIGINTARADADNIGFAIAISDVKGVIDGVIANGKLEVPYLGVRYQTITDATATREDLASKQGAWVRGTQGFPAVIKDSPADKAGIKDQDIIIKVDGQELNQDNILNVMIGRHKVGDQLSLIIIRNNEEIETKVTLEAAPTNLE
ncbi:trypsin-like peptidase domain-containing protein [Candidatus Saccharibacteria bacterium]|nr:trypsin-like peptidase domain-containing protein [Candidatus Saccharibacteria bacterium]MCB9821318.1 trypsin-like peptidase domain-containing protein [Candidatus Nomurabacteria bacterium]